MNWQMLANLVPTGGGSLVGLVAAWAYGSENEVPCGFGNLSRCVDLPFLGQMTSEAALWMGVAIGGLVGLGITWWSSRSHAR